MVIPERLRSEPQSLHPIHGEVHGRYVYTVTKLFHLNARFNISEILFSFSLLFASLGDSVVQSFMCSYISASYSGKVLARKSSLAGQQTHS